MANINNHFMKAMTRLRTSFILSFILVMAPAAILCALASDPIFTVEDVKVDVTAENAIAAREKAFEQAQVKAFEELTARMIPDADLATTKTPAPNIISTMINDFELTNEKLSTVRYIGTYTFRFRDREVRRYFAKKGTAVSSVSSQKLLVLPFYNRDGRNILWTPGNFWMQAWNRVPNLTGVVPLEVPIGDIGDVRDIGDGEALNYDPTGLSNLLKRYGAQEAVIAIATPDEELTRIIDPLAIAKGSVIIEIFRTDRRAPELVQQVTATADGALTRQQLFDRGVTLVRSELQKDWKSRTAVPAAPSMSSINLAVPINSLNGWIGIQTQLKRISSIDDVVLKSLTPKQANIQLKYKGTPDRLELMLAQAGMEIEQATASDGSPVKILKSARYSSESYSASY